MAKCDHYSHNEQCTGANLTYMYRAVLRFSPHRFISDTLIRRNTRFIAVVHNERYDCKRVFIQITTMSTSFVHVDCSTFTSLYRRYKRQQVCDKRHNVGTCPKRGSYGCNVRSNWILCIPFRRVIRVWIVLQRLLNGHRIKKAHRRMDHRTTVLHVCVTRAHAGWKNYTLDRCRLGVCYDGTRWQSRFPTPVFYNNDRSVSSGGWGRLKPFPQIFQKNYKFLSVFY